MKYAVALLAAVGLLVGVFYTGRCTGDDHNPDQPPAIIDSTAVVDEFDFGPDIPLLERPFRRRSEVRRAGVAPGAARAAVDSFVAAATDSAARPVFPLTRGRVRGDVLSLRLPRSDGAYVAQDMECPRSSGCDFGADSTIWATHDRALPRLLPQIGKTAAICAATGLAGWGIAKAVDYSEPVMVGGVAASGCVLLRVVG